MCIVFLNSGDGESDFSFVLAANRDEFIDRPAKNADFWAEDNAVIGGKDMEEGSDEGTWLAISPSRHRIGVILNLPGNNRKGLKTRGKIVKDFVMSSLSIEEYVKELKDYGRETNSFIFVIIEFGASKNKIQTYSNATDKLQTWSENYLGFSNSLPDSPLKKVVEGKKRFKSICQRLNREEDKNELIRELTELMRWDQRHLPDPEIERRSPAKYEALSSVCVRIPEARYGTRTHTFIVVTKSGHLDFVEFTMKAPIDPLKPEWITSAFEFDIGQA